MKFYLRDDLRYDYKRITKIYKAIIAVLVMVCIVLIVVISNNDQALKKNLISNVSAKDLQNDTYEQASEKEIKQVVDEDNDDDKSSWINSICGDFIAFVRDKKSYGLKAYFSNAFRTQDEEQTSFEAFKEDCIVDCLSIRYEDDQLNTIITDTESKNDEQSSKAEKYLYLIKYNYKPSNKKKFNDQRFHINQENLKNSSLKTLTVLSS